jgi:FkbM family methyltransferase
VTSPRQLLKRAILAPLRVEPVRSRVAFWLNQEHYPELDIQVPLSHSLTCPIYSPEYWCSFSEVFVQSEYASVFERVVLPNRWLDIGCHAGFFSLYVEWQRRMAGMTQAPKCALVDADKRVAAAIAKLNAANNLEFEFIHAGVSKPGETLRFTERSFMASSASDVDSSGGIEVLVPTATVEKLNAVLPAPYDIVKVDIEGAEFELLHHYRPLLAQTRHLILEWHSWHNGGGGKAQLVSLASALGFDVCLEVRPDHEVLPGKFCGVLLLQNRAFAFGQSIAV